LDSLDDDNLDEYSKHEATLRLLRSTMRKYKRVAEELERLKAATGFNKPFPILRLPREIRDEIYTHSLRAPKPVLELPWAMSPVLDADNPFKPPTLGLLRTNKQVYHEAVEILYSRNIFVFREPQQLFALEEQIVSANWQRVRQICIWMIFPRHDVVIPDPKDVIRSDYDSFPSHWIAAMKQCRFESITHLGIEAEALSSSPLSLLLMPAELQEYIHEVLGRVSDNKVPKLSLTEFLEKERDRFPKRWEVVIDQWDDYKAEFEATSREWEGLAELEDLEEPEENPSPQ
jgi:hypothetical protein